MTFKGMANARSSECVFLFFRKASIKLLYFYIMHGVEVSTKAHYTQEVPNDEFTAKRVTG